MSILKLLKKKNLLVENYISISYQMLRIHALVNPFYNLIFFLGFTIAMFFVA